LAGTPLFKTTVDDEIARFYRSARLYFIMRLKQPKLTTVRIPSRKSACLHYHNIGADFLFEDADTWRLDDVLPVKGYTNVGIKSVLIFKKPD
jgi:hypothetical protein